MAAKRKPRANGKNGHRPVTGEAARQDAARQEAVRHDALRSEVDNLRADRDQALAASRAKTAFVGSWSQSAAPGQ